MSVAQRLADLRSRAANAATRVGRDPGEVRILAVTKTVSPERIREALAAGQTLFGENYVQEAKAKREAFGSEAGFELHFIGALQRNKAKDAVRLFSMVHTVDRVELADALEKACAHEDQSLDVLMQVNISDEATKSGVEPARAAELASEILARGRLRLRGLMCIGSYFEESESEELRRSEFRKIRALRDELASALKCELPELSMGMSHDFELAIEEGATIVRVGTALFGERSQ